MAVLIFNSRARQVTTPHFSSSHSISNHTTPPPRPAGISRPSIGQLFPLQVTSCQFRPLFTPLWHWLPFVPKYDECPCMPPNCDNRLHPFLHRRVSEVLIVERHLARKRLDSSPKLCLKCSVRRRRRPSVGGELS